MFAARTSAIPLASLDRQETAAVGYAARRRWQLLRVWAAAMLVAAVIILIFALWAGVQRWNELGRPAEEVEFVTLYVQPGDTLWDIAVRHGPAHWDARRTLEAVNRINGLQEGAHTPLMAGEALVVPVSRTP